jgi:acetyl esterase/lipase
VVAIVALSPITDLTLSGESWSARAKADPFFTREQAEGLVALYLNDRPAGDPRASPLFGDQSGLPPIRIHVGDDEVLRDDAVRYGERASAAGVDLEVHVWDGMAHVFTSSTGMLDAADAATGMVGAFLADRLTD